MTRVSTAWLGTLTSAQRATWADYSEQLALRYGATRVPHLSGQQLFLRANLSRQLAAFGIIATAPTLYETPMFSPLTINWTAPIALLTMFFGNTDEWAFDPNGGMVVFVGESMSRDTHFYAGPWRRATIIRGSTPVPPAIPRVVTDPWGSQTRFTRWMRYYVFRGDGRLAPQRIEQFA